MGTAERMTDLLRWLLLDLYSDEGPPAGPVANLPFLDLLEWADWLVSRN